MQLDICRMVLRTLFAKTGLFLNFRVSVLLYGVFLTSLVDQGELPPSVEDDGAGGGLRHGSAASGRRRSCTSCKIVTLSYHIFSIFINK